MTSTRPKMSRARLWATTSACAGLVLSACTSTAMNDRPSGGPATGATGSGTSTGTGGGGGGDWCQVQSILRDNCQDCHGAQPLFGAPMPLVTFDNLHAHAVTNPSL